MNVQYGQMMWDKLALSSFHVVMNWKVTVDDLGLANIESN